MRDIKGIVFNKGLRIGTSKLLRSVYNPLSYLICYVKGIKLGSECSFYGLTKFYRTPSSKINIGKNDSFLSKTTSNLIGINHKCIISTLNKDAEIIIGHNSGFSGVTISAAKKITIGDNVKCGANVLITDFDWHQDDPRSGTPREIVIEDNVWLGVNTVVLKGVIIGKNSLIGANSVVTSCIPENVIAAGNPCKVLRRL